MLQINICSGQTGSKTTTADKGGKKNWAVLDVNISVSQGYKNIFLHKLNVSLGFLSHQNSTRWPLLDQQHVFYFSRTKMTQYEEILS